VEEDALLDEGLLSLVQYKKRREREIGVTIK
jgi:hypothetical protein